MGNYENLKMAISAVIKTNGNQEITGDILQNVLKSIIDTIGYGAVFAGVATPITEPLSPDQNVFYLAAVNGTYSNFGGIVINDEVCVLSNASGTWQKVGTGIASAQAIQTLNQVLTLAELDELNTIGKVRNKFGKFYGRGFLFSRLAVPVGTFEIVKDEPTVSGIVQRITSAYEVDANGAITSSTIIGRGKMPVIHTLERTTTDGTWSKWYNANEKCEFAGIATPTSTPEVGNYMYFASQDGTYTNFGGIRVNSELALLYTLNCGNTWSKLQIHGVIPSVQTNNSGNTTNYVYSDGYNDSDKCVVSFANTSIFQSNEGWSAGKLVMRLGQWGSNTAYKTTAIPTATKDCDGIMSKEDKKKLSDLEPFGVQNYGTENFAAVIENRSTTIIAYQLGAEMYYYDERDQMQARVSAMRSNVTLRASNSQKSKTLSLSPDSATIDGEKIATLGALDFTNFEIFKSEGKYIIYVDVSWLAQRLGLDISEKSFNRALYEKRSEIPFILASVKFQDGDNIYITELIFDIKYAFEFEVGDEPFFVRITSHHLVDEYIGTSMYFELVISN